MKNWRTTASGIVGAVTGILSYIASVPPELQAQVPQLFPEQYRGTIGLWLRVITGLALLYLGKSAKDASSTASPNPSETPNSSTSKDSLQAQPETKTP